MKNIKNILVIGTGPTGSSLIFLLSKLNRHLRRKINIKAIDKGGLPGGRLTTTFYKNSNDYKYNLGFNNLGSKTPNNLHMFSYQDYLLNLNNNFYFKKGFTEIFQHNLQDLDIQYNTKVEKIQYNEYKNSKWSIKTNNNKLIDYDLIISTIPIPQLLSLKGNFINYFDYSLRRSMNEVKYCSILSMGLSFSNEIDNRIWKDISICGNNILEYVNLNINERYKNTNIVVQCKPKWSIDNFYQDKKYIYDKIIFQLSNIIPEVSELNTNDIKLMRWKYAKIINNSNLYNVYEDTSILVNNSLPFILSGDSVCGSQFNNCLESALSAYKKCEKIILEDNFH